MKTYEFTLIFIIGTLTMFVFVLFLILIMIEYRKKQARHITEKVKLENQFRNEVLQTKLEVQEQTFRYVSEEIHDNIAQTLSLVKMKLYHMSDNMGNEDQKRKLESSTSLLGNALQSLRSLSHILNGGLVSQLSLRENIEKELNYVRDVNNIKAGLKIFGSLFEPEPEKKLLIVRIVQEAINNAIKHGKASEININMSYVSGLFTVQIADNGLGFDVDEWSEHKKGLGLHNIYNRAKLLGDLDIQSAKLKGTIITLDIQTNET